MSTKSQQINHKFHKNLNKTTQNSTDKQPQSDSQSTKEQKPTTTTKAITKTNKRRQD